nr:UvrABC system protein B [Chlamydiota bacterium]
INDLRRGLFDVLVGINLLREGLDIPEVSLVAILDADKEGFLRSETSLIQTCGRASRNQEGRVILYADKMTKSIQSTLDITKQRRRVQEEYNQEHGIIPQTIKRGKVESIFETFGKIEPTPLAAEEGPSYLSKEDVAEKIREYGLEMKRAAKELRFEDAAHYRDQLQQFKKLELLEDNL